MGLILTMFRGGEGESSMGRGEKQGLGTRQIEVGTLRDP